MKKSILIVCAILVFGVAGYFGYQYATESSTPSAPPVQAPEVSTDQGITISASGDPFVYKQKWTVGQKRVLQMESISSTETQVKSQPNPIFMVQKITQEMAMTTLTTRPNGDYEIEVRIQDFKMEMDMNKQHIVFDAKSDSTIGIYKEVGPMFRTMLESTITVILGPDGEQKEISGVSELVENIRKNQKGSSSQQIGMFFKEQYFISQFKNLFTNTLPTRSIQTGENFTFSKDIELPGSGPSKVDLKYIFDGWREINGKKYAMLHYDGSIQGNNKAAPIQPGIQMNFKSMKFAGYTLVDPEDGMGREFSQNQYVDIDITTKNQTPQGPREDYLNTISHQQVKGKMFSVPAETTVP